MPKVLHFSKQKVIIIISKIYETLNPCRGFVTSFDIPKSLNFHSKSGHAKAKNNLFMKVR